MTQDLPKQVGGDHYEFLQIGPAEYATANALSYNVGCMVKYATRYQVNGDPEDLAKMISFARLELALKTQKTARDPRQTERQNGEPVEAKRE